MSLDTVNFLGFVIQKGSMKADSGKMKAVAEWLVPTNPRQLYMILGFATFCRKLIKNYSSITAPPKQTHLFCCIVFMDQGSLSSFSGVPAHLHPHSLSARCHKFVNCGGG